MKYKLAGVPPEGHPEVPYMLWDYDDETDVVVVNVGEKTLPRLTLAEFIYLARFAAQVLETTNDGHTTSGGGEGPGGRPNRGTNIPNPGPSPG